MKSIARSLLAATVLIAGVAVAADNPPLVEAEVRKVDTAAAKITLKHAEIPTLEMPPMTMVFQIKNPAALPPLKAGDLVRFRAEKINGAYVASDIEPRR
jgi:Cu(I)/Ag(I) efflux system periplasmic protein CusF